MSSFTSELIASPLPDGRRWKLKRQFSYDVGKKGSAHKITVPAGFITDFASIPQIVIVIMSILCVLAGHFFALLWLLLLGCAIIIIITMLPNWGRYGKAAVLHDFLYQRFFWMIQQPEYSYFFIHFAEAIDNPRKFADSIFYEAMIAGKTKPWKAKLMYQNVRLFGWLAWSRKRNVQVV